MNVDVLAAIVFAMVAAGAVGFQLAMAAGAPWGSYAMGGAFPGRFPPTLRVLAVIQAAIIAVLALVVLAHAGLVLPGLATAAPWSIWVVVVFSAVALVLNLASRSGGERRIWVPVALVLLGTSLIVALGPARLTG